jgi:hypothetical protein
MQLPEYKLHWICSGYVPFGDCNVDDEPAVQCQETFNLSEYLQLLQVDSLSSSELLKRRITKFYIL